MYVGRDSCEICNKGGKIFEWSKNLTSSENLGLKGTYRLTWNLNYDRQLNDGVNILVNKSWLVENHIATRVWKVVKNHPLTIRGVEFYPFGYQL